MSPPLALPAPGHSHETELALLRAGLESQKELVTEFRGLMISVQAQISNVATRQQVEQIHRELVEAQAEQSRELEAMKLMLRGPQGQPEEGLLSIVRQLRARVEIQDRRWERVIGYVLGAGAAGGGIGALAHSLLTAVGK